jgi:hypothetical protein
MGVAWVYWRIYSLRVEQYIPRRYAPLDILQNPSGVYSPIHPCHAHYIITILHLGNCAKVSKNFRIIAYDSRLWQKVSICSGPIPDNFIEQAMARGTKYIGLANVCASANPKPNFPKTNQVKYLTLSGSNMEETYFR